MEPLKVPVTVSVKLDMSPSSVHVPAAMTGPEPERALTKHAALCIVWDNDGRVLTITRPETPDEYSIPGGIVEDGETPVAAAVRELLEECGVRAESAYCRWDGCENQKPLTEDGRQVHACVASQWSGIPHPSEFGTKCQWLTVDELMGQAKKFKSFLTEMKKRGCFEDYSSFPSRGLGMNDAGTSTNLGELDAEKRNKLASGEFALPKQRKYPIHDAAHVRNAAVRLEQMHKAHKISEADYHEARGRIAAAAKKYGIESEYNESAREAEEDQPKLHVRIHHPQHGEMEIRHMKDGSHLMSGLRVKLDLAEMAGAENGPVWCHIATRGHFEGHGAGPFDLNDEVFKDLIRNYRDVDLGEVAFDFEHASEADATAGTIPSSGAPAQGWIKDLKIGDKGLYALVAWGDLARNQIRSGQYKFVSPAIRFGARHPVTGKPIGARLTSVALTNQPFLRGLQPLAAKDRVPTVTLGGRSYAYSADEYMPMLRSCLGADEEASAQELCNRMKAMRAMHAMPEGRSMIAGNIASLRDGMRVPMHSTVEDIFDAVDAMIAAAIKDHEDRMHAGQAAMTTKTTTAAAVAATQQETTAMTEQTNATPNADLAIKLSNADASIAKLTLQLGEREATITAKDDVIKAKDAEIVSLKADVAKRDEADLDRMVATAILYHGESQKLTGKEKMLRLYAKSEPEEFKKTYPIPVDASGKPVQPYMLRSVDNAFGAGGSREVPTTTNAGAEAPVGQKLTIPQLAVKLIDETMKDGKATMSLEEAQNEAIKLRQSGTR